MKRPNITPAPWELSAGRCIKTPSGDFHLSYGHDKATSAPRFRSPTELDRIAEAAAALPDTLRTLEKFHTWLTAPALDKQTLQEMQDEARQALIKAGYEFP